MLRLPRKFVLPLSLLLLVSLFGVVLTHPHGTHSHGSQAASNQHAHSHSHPQHDSADEPDHPELTARLSGMSFILNFATFTTVSTTNVSDPLSCNTATHETTNSTRQSEPTLSRTRVYLL